MSMKTDKLISNDNGGVNQILPHTNKWAWDIYLTSLANTWVPNDIKMNTDVEQWRSKTAFSDDERLVIKRCLGFFAGSESLVSNNLLLSIYKYITDPECRQYISRQSYEESLHNLTIVYICDSLSLDINEVYEAYKSIPAIKAKDDFLLKVVNDDIGDINDIEMKRRFFRNLFAYYIICEGIFFYSGFAMLLSFGRQNKLPGTAKQIEYTLRDESMHIKFGTALLNKLKFQFPEVWTKEFEAVLLDDLDKAAQLEIAYAHDVLPRGILGLNANMFIDYIKYIANRRLTDLGIPPVYSNAQNPFGWMSETMDLTKMGNFFETRITDYQSGTLQDDY